MSLEKIQQDGVRPVDPGEPVRIDPELQLANGRRVAPNSIEVTNGIWLDTDTNEASSTYGTFRIQNITTDPQLIQWVAKFDHSIQNRADAPLQTGVGPLGLQPAPPAVTILAPSGTTGIVELQRAATKDSVFFNTLTDALAAASPGDLVLGTAGSYDEKPAVPDGVTLRGRGDNALEIAPADPTGTRVTLGEGATIENVRVTAPTDAAYAIEFAGATLAVVRYCGIIGQGGLGRGVGNTGAGQLIVDVCFGMGAGAMVSLLHFASGAFLAKQIDPTVGTFAAIIEVEGGAGGQLFELDASPTAIVTDGLLIRDGALVASGVNLLGVTNAIHFADNAANLQLRDFIFDSNTLDILVDALLTTGTMRLINGQLDAEKISIPGPWAALATFEFSVFTPFIPNIAVRQNVDLSVGTVVAGKRTYFGEGLGTNTGVIYQRNDSGEAGTWTDITAILSSLSGSTAPLLDGLGVDNTFYVGGGLPFVSLFSDIVTALDVGTGSLVLEYWFDNTIDPPSWVEINAMAFLDLPPYNQYANTPFQRAQNEDLLYAPTPNWATKTLNGFDKYWLRFRVATALTGGVIPVAEYMKPGNNRKQTGIDGFELFFGSSQPQRELPVHIRLMEDIDGAVAANQDVDISATVMFNSQDNALNNGARDGRGINVIVPKGLDTSKPLTFCLRWKTNNANAGDVELQFYVTEAYTVGDVLDGTLSEIADPQVITVPGVTGEVIETLWTFSIPDALPGDAFGIGLIRDARAGNDPPDTYAGNAGIVSVELFGRSWAI